jgi:hypothetical protein
MSIPAQTTGQAVTAAVPNRRQSMSQPVPATHPSVVLRSHYTHLRALLAAATIAILGLTAAVVILATDDGRSTAVSTAAPATAPDPSGARYDGGPDEGTRGAVAARSLSVPPSPSARYDGGPEEGSAALIQRSATPTSKPSARYDGGPEEGSAALIQRSATPTSKPSARYDGGPEEGTTGPSR